MLQGCPGVICLRRSIKCRCHCVRSCFCILAALVAVVVYYVAAVNAGGFSHFQLELCQCSLEKDCETFLKPGAKPISSLPSGCEWEKGPTTVDDPQGDIEPDLTTILGDDFRTRRCPQYTQWWTVVQGLPSDPVSEYPKLRNLRATAIAVPNRTAPPGGWPFVLHFMFMLANGDAQKWFGNSFATEGGLLDRDMSDIELWRATDVQGRYQMQEVLHGLIDQGYALIMTSQYSTDNMFYNPNIPGDECDATWYGDGCWNHGDNPDASYMAAVLEKVKKGTLVPGVKFDYSRMGIMGYSVGAQMVSRSINDFPVMQLPSGAPFPKISAAVMINGGSYYCYAYSDKLPANYLPCKRHIFNIDALAPDLFESCCPHNQTEEVFDNGTRAWDQHPPVLLLQTTMDIFADPAASEYYYNIMATKSRTAQVCRVIAGGPVVALRHGLAQVQTMPLIKFMTRYV